MILFAALGYAAHRWMHWRPGLAVGVLVGIVIANFVPVNAACGLRRDSESEQ